MHNYYRHANRVLLVLILLINGYVLLSPLWPSLAFWWQRNHTATHQRFVTEIHAPLPAQSSGSTATQDATNHLVIPDMLLDQPINEAPVSQIYRVLDKGIWRWPKGSQPGQPGNTVMLGHRFTYTNPRGVFYQLDKVKLGSEIAVYWSGQRYLYSVSDIQIVSPSDDAIQQPTADTRLTLYTCTPLWHPVTRLVITAKPLRSSL